MGEGEVWTVMQWEREVVLVGGGGERKEEG